MNRLMRQTARASHNTHHLVCLKNVDIALEGCANRAVQAYEGTLQRPDGNRHIKKHCPIGDDSHALLEKAIDKFGLSARAFNRILKIARTIADLTGSEDINVIHISEMIQYRSLGRKNLFRGEVCCALGIFDCFKPRFDKDLSDFCQKLFQNLRKSLFIFFPLVWIIPKSGKKRHRVHLQIHCLTQTHAPIFNPDPTLASFLAQTLLEVLKTYKHIHCNFFVIFFASPGKRCGAKGFTFEKSKLLARVGHKITGLRPDGYGRGDCQMLRKKSAFLSRTADFFIRFIDRSKGGYPCKKIMVLSFPLSGMSYQKALL